MATKQISELPEATQLNAEDLLLIQQDGVAKKVQRKTLEGGTVSAIAITESADGTVTMVNTLSSGETETIVIGADANGNPNKLTVNGKEIPIDWVVSA